MKRLVLFNTNTCNFRCKTCLRDYGKSENIPLELIKRRFHEIKQLGYTGVSFTGGEPCLHPEFEQFVEYFAANNFKMGFVSNGSLIERYSFIVNNHRSLMEFMCVSLDGSTAEVYELIRQNGDFYKTVEAIKYFTSQGIYTKTSICINKLNMHQVEDMVRLSGDLGVKTVVLIAMIKTKTNVDIALNDNEKLQIKNQANLFRTNCNVELVIASSLGACEGIEFCNSLNLNDLAINPTGDVIFCCDTIRNGAVLGNLENESFTGLYSKALDMSSKLKMIRAKMIANNETMPGFNSCEFCNHFMQDKINAPAG